MAQVTEVVVTARKREESILNVPVVVAAFTQEQLQQYATHDLYDIANQVPGFLIGSGTGAYGAQISIRGVGTSTQNAAIDQSVTLAIDGMQMSQGLAYKVGMFDLAQIEVLKGPQALFYGKASTGGVISIRSADPGKELEVISNTGYEFEANEKKQELIVSGPVTDTLGLRLAASYSGMDGYFTNDGTATPGFGQLTPSNRDFAPSRSLLVRGTALWKPSEVFSARLKANYTRDRVQGDGGALMQFTSCPEGTASLSGIPFLGNGENCRLDRKAYVTNMDPAAYPGIRNGGVPFNHMNQTFGTLELNYRFAEQLNLTSVSGYYHVVQPTLLNGLVATTNTIAPDNNFRRHDFTQELRLASDFENVPVNFTTGAFYQKGYLENSITLLGNTALMLPGLLQRGIHKVDIDSISGFGQLLWRITSRLELAGGGRWTHEKRTHTQDTLTTGIPVRAIDQSFSSNHFSPEVSLTYRPTDDLTAFTSYRRAYKSGSFDVTVVYDPGTDTAFGDETAKGFEAGIKARLFDRQVNLNLAGYRYVYEDLQVGAADNTSGVISIRTLNAASATIYGVDADAVYEPAQVSGLALRLGVNWNHGRYDKFTNAPCWGGQTIAQGCNQLFNSATGLYNAEDLSGGKLVRAPDWSATFGVDYAVPVGNDMTLSLGSSTLYSSSYFTNLIPRSDSVQGSYFKANASVSLKGRDDGWALALIANNIGDKLVMDNCVTSNFTNGIFFGGQTTGGLVSGPAGQDETLCSVERGRSVWLRLTLKAPALFQ
jgi:iron complex outermembrane receptor protein